MPKYVPQDELDAVLEVVKGLSPASLGEIAKALPLKLSRRTLQRRLAQLVAQRRLVERGNGRARQYLILRTVSVKVAWHIGYPGISTDAKNIRKSVGRPIQERDPVSYNQEFLYAYHPNSSYYLPAETRQRLRELGRLPGHERPAGTYARQIFDRLLIDLSWNSSRLEGNTYSLLETERLLQLGEVAEGKNVQEAQMILNHKDAIEFITEAENQINFNRRTVLNLHALLSNNLLDDPQAGGRLRQIPVQITGTVYIPLAVPQRIEEYFLKILDTAVAIDDPFEQAFFAMMHLAYLQPFDDVNKRVSRFAANIPFIRQNLCPLSFVDVLDVAYLEGIIGVYELNRVELLRDVFVWAYERSCARYSAISQSLSEPDPFRLRYRERLVKAVSEIVRKPMDKKSAIAFIRQQASENITFEDAAKFIEVAETELMSLHEGNFARYRLRPSEYEVWKKGWR
ncbi:MAG: Fic family protein [Alphaproteobacteria bacterium]